MAEKFYTNDHEWIEKVDGNKVRVGVSDYAQDQLGDVVFVELPDVDDEFDASEDFGTVESVKSTSELAIPLAGKVVNVNEELEDSPELINESPEADGWIVEFELEDELNTDDLYDESAYKEYIDSL